MKKDISIIVIILVVLTFFVRVGSFKKEHPLTYDEVVYSTLAAQLGDNPENYNTKGLYNDALKKGRKLPEYFNKPLFKHPPLFSYIILANYKISGRTYYSAFKVSLFFGVLLIILAYLMGSTLFDSRVGAYAAFLMAIEPISWISSQKIWLETTLAFFMVLSLYLFIRTVKKYNPYIIILSGISGGLAVLTKYPGLLAAFTIAVYAICCERWMYKKKGFIFSLLIPFIMLIPWMHWNFSIYGAGFFTDFLESHHELGRFLERVYASFMHNLPIFLAVALFLLFLVFLRKKKPVFYEKIFPPRIKLLPTSLILILLSIGIFVLREHVINSWNINHIPAAGWKIGMFSKEPWYFYIIRLLEIFPFYIFSFLALLLFAIDRDNLKNYIFLFLSVFSILVFYILWKNYQSRYILSLVVPLVILSSKMQFYLFDKIKKIEYKNVKYLICILGILIVLFFIAKSIRIDYLLAVPNRMCYF